MIKGREKMLLNLYQGEETYFMICGLRKFEVKVTQSHIMTVEGFKNLHKSGVRAIKECGKLRGTRRDLGNCISLRHARSRWISLDV